MTPTQFTIKATAAAALALLAAAATAQTSGKMNWNDTMMKAADSNADGMVSRQEFQDHMGQIWDREHAMMMKGDAKMPRDGMKPEHFRHFSNNYMRDPGKIGGN